MQEGLKNGNQIGIPAGGQVVIQSFGGSINFYNSNKFEGPQEPASGSLAASSENGRPHAQPHMMQHQSS